MSYVLQSPDETKLHSYDWTDDLASGDSISSDSWSISPSSGVTVSDQALSGNVSSTLISGLTRGEVYALTGEIVTADGETKRVGIAIRCANK